MVLAAIFSFDSHEPALSISIISLFWEKERVEIKQSKKSSFSFKSLVICMILQRFENIKAIYR